MQHDLLFEIVDMVHESDTQGALLFVERLNEGGTDYAQFIKDLLAHLRDLYVVKHTDQTPASIAATEEQLDRLRSQASRVSTSRTVGFIDLLGEALRSIRQGSDPRLELELVLIKMTALHDAMAELSSAPAAPAERPAPRATAPAPPAVPRPAAASAARRPCRAAGNEPGGGRPGRTGPPHQRPHRRRPPPRRRSRRTDAAVDRPPTARGRRRHRRPPPTRTGSVRADIDHLKRAWPVVIEAVKKRQPGLAAVLGEGSPDSLNGNELLVKFPAGYSFQANMVAREDNRALIAEALGEITGKELRVVTKLGAEPAPEPAEKKEDARILSKDELLRVLKLEFDAHIVDDGPTR